MEKNANINARLVDLLDVLDARKTVNVFLKEYKGDGQISIRYDTVYELLADKDFMRAYKNHEVFGLNLGLVTNILIGIEEEGI